MPYVQNPQKRPIHPEQLLEKLLNQNYKDSECQDSALKFKQEKQVILQLIAEYELTIQKTLLSLQQQGPLFELRARLIAELQKIKMQRQLIEQQIVEEISRVRICNRQDTTRDSQKIQIDLRQVRCCNSKLRVRIRELHDYVQKLQVHNAKLESQRKIIQSNTINRMRISEDQWRHKIQNLRRTQQAYEQQAKVKLQTRQLTRQAHIRQQQENMFERNRKAFNQARLRSRTFDQPSIPIRQPRHNVPPFIPRVGVAFSSSQMPLPGYHHQGPNRYRVI